ncbi:hypothetical protein HYDPIDRAFT_100521 [Hydnomerulius pinastri MD-312]|uniref:Uncharacterized protein n=1 Tax=Hydnomerulius pinastri MD-312 TaxID=994086 RepID=A0A0C9W8U8_9AGAM|nr:hypothetical protein HYDPIDRAFT_100521 [Hydnomerulius pinastri MD-312]
MSQHSRRDSDDEEESSPSGQKRPHSSALQSGPRKRPNVQDPLVHHGRHFGCVVHAFCNVQTLITNGLVLMGELEDRGAETLTQQERKEYSAFRELLKMVPELEARLMSCSEEDVVSMAELASIRNCANGARADNTKSMKSAIIDWITPKGQTLNPHIPQNMKSGCGFNHEHTGALLCPAGYKWANVEVKAKLHSGQIQVVGDQWPVFLYANYTYDPEDPWNGLLRSGLLASAYKHIFTSPSSARFALTSAQVFSRTDLVTDLERFYNSILELLEDPDEAEEVDQLMTWWNRQIFPLYTECERLPSKNSVLARIQQKQAEYKAAVDAAAGGE